MKALILETFPRPKNPIAAHIRNSIQIKLALIQQGHSAQIAFLHEDMDEYGSDYDLIMVSYGSRFAFFFNFEEFVQRNPKARWGWITNEYDLSANSVFVKIFREKGACVLANYDEGTVKLPWCDSFHSVNMNTMLFQQWGDCERTHDFIYYGTFRKDRERYFRAYLDKKFHVSTTAKNCKKFLHIGCKPKFLPKIDWQNPVLKRFRFSLYIEDEFTHTHFNNLSNRFYESLGAGCVVLFDENCRNTLEKSEIDGWEEFLVTPKTINQISAKDYERMFKIQVKWIPVIKKEAAKTKKSINDFLIGEMNG